MMNGNGRGHRTKAPTLSSWIWQRPVTLPKYRDLAAPVHLFFYPAFEVTFVTGVLLRRAEARSFRPLLSLAVANSLTLSQDATPHQLAG